MMYVYLMKNQKPLNEEVVKGHVENSSFADHLPIIREAWWYLLQKIWRKLKRSLNQIHSWHWAIRPVRSGPWNRPMKKIIIS